MNKYTGVLPDTAIKSLFDRGNLRTESPLDKDQIQPASLDLRLGSIAYRIRASFLPGKNVKVYDKLNRLKLHEIDLTDGAILETGCVYLVPLQEQLYLSEGMEASANPKSSTGRLDIFTRIITDNSQAFDQIAINYHGPLFLEISPSTFPVVLRRGSRLSQIRFRQKSCILDYSQMHALHLVERLIDTNNPNIVGGGIGISIDLRGDQSGLVGYRGKRHTGIVDIDQNNSLEILDFWEPIYTRHCNDLVLDPNEFYILASREAVHVPPNYAAEMVPFDPLFGEFRVHYAGFFDPGFGHVDGEGSGGARAVLEVRSREVPFILEDGQLIGRLRYEPMLQRPKNLYGQRLGSNYQGQGLKLSKHFKS